MIGSYHSLYVHVSKLHSRVLLLHDITNSINIWFGAGPACVFDIVDVATAAEIAGIYCDPDDVAPILIDMLGDPSPIIRRGALDGLSAICQDVGIHTLGHGFITKLVDISGKHNELKPIIDDILSDSNASRSQG